jgi:hypothetical protein
MSVKMPEQAPGTMQAVWRVHFPEQLPKSLPDTRDVEVIHRGSRPSFNSRGLFQDPGQHGISGFFLRSNTL